MLLVGACQSSAWARHGLDVWAEFGPEFDSNPLRLNDNDVDERGVLLAHVGAPLVRTALGSALTFARKAHELHLTWEGGGKLYLDRAEARAADELVLRTALTWGWHLARRLTLSTTGSYYDIFQGDTELAPAYVQRDFRTGTAMTRFAARTPGGASDFSVDLGYQGLQFKAREDNLSYHAALAGLAARRLLSRGSTLTPTDWSIGAQYAMTLRLYQGQALDEQGFPRPDERHRDMTHVWRADLRRVSAADLALWYAFEYHGSNTYGEAFGRHVVGLSFTTPLVWETYLTATGIFRISSFSDTLISATAQQRRRFLEDENRSRLGVTLSHALGEAWSLGVRYNIYINEATSFADDEDDADSHLEKAPGYLRQTAMFVVRFEYGTAQ